MVNSRLEKDRWEQRGTSIYKGGRGERGALPFRDTISRGIDGTLPLTRRTRVDRVLITVLEKKRKRGRGKAKEGKRKRYEKASISAKADISARTNL